MCWCCCRSHSIRLGGTRCRLRTWYGSTCHSVAGLFGRSEAHVHVHTSSERGHARPNVRRLRKTSYFYPRGKIPSARRAAPIGRTNRTTTRTPPRMPEQTPQRTSPHTGADGTWEPRGHPSRRQSGRQSGLPHGYLSGRNTFKIKIEFKNDNPNGQIVPASKLKSN